MKDSTSMRTTLASLTKEVSRILREIEKLERNQIRYTSCKTEMPKVGQRVLGYLTAESSWKSMWWVDGEWSTGRYSYPKGAVSHWIDPATLPKPKGGKRGE